MSQMFGRLEVTGVLLSQDQACLWPEGYYQRMVLVALHDPKTGASGHLLYCLQVNDNACPRYGDDIVQAEAWTDEPSLFPLRWIGKECPHPLDLLQLPDDSTPAARTAQTDAIISHCRNGAKVQHEEHGVAGSGLYACKQ